MWAGINDYANADPGVWKVYAGRLRPRGALARVWLKYHMRKLGEDHFAAGLAAKEAGMTVCFTAVGAPEHRTTDAELSKERYAMAPDDARAWAAQVAGDVEALRARGVPVSHVEIWNEPDLAEHWKGSREQFARFFAVAGRELAARLPQVRVGGPGMARGHGHGLEWFEAILVACEQEGFAPAFLSWHDYVGYPTDQEAFELPQRVRTGAAAHGFGDVELIVSEWNLALPRPRAPELDDHRGAAYFVAMTTSMIRAGLDHAMFFFLQDGAWETKRDYAGESVGVFTLHGGPKAVFNGMQMVAKAASVPGVESARLDAPWNLSLRAGREAGRGFVIAANSFGNVEKHVRKLLDRAGADVDRLQGREREVLRYLGGSIELEQLGTPIADRRAWESARAAFETDRLERGLADRSVRIGLLDPPERVARVWRIDAAHGNPLQDPAYAKLFGDLQASAPERAGRAAVEQLRQEGVAEPQLASLEAALAKGRRPDRGDVDAALATRAARAYRKAMEQVQFADTQRLAEHPACSPWPAAAAAVRLKDGRLEFELPPDGAILIELAWSGKE
ncbi:MAG TPA: hypothetical protein VGC54_02765 [Planctomycetota bacterium]